MMQSTFPLTTQARLHQADRIAIVTKCGLQNSALLMNGWAMVFALMRRRRVEASVRSRVYLNFGCTTDFNPLMLGQATRVNRHAI